MLESLKGQGWLVNKTLTEDSVFWFFLALADLCNLDPPNGDNTCNALFRLFGAEAILCWFS